MKLGGPPNLERRSAPILVPEASAPTRSFRTLVSLSVSAYHCVIALASWPLVARQLHF